MNRLHRRSSVLAINLPRPSTNCAGYESFNLEGKDSPIVFVWNLVEPTYIQYLHVTGDSNTDNGGDDIQWKPKWNCEQISNNNWYGARLFVSNSTDIADAVQCGTDLDFG